MKGKQLALITLLVAGFLLLSAYYNLNTGKKEVIRISTTTSLEDTGLLEELEAAFEGENPDIDVQIVSGGTGISLERAKRGDADLVMVHDRSRENEFISTGYGLKRYPFAYNHFYILGPPDDPAGINGSTDASEAFRTIIQGAAKNPQKVKFVSRGDNSGTNTREIEIWTSITDYNTIRDTSWYIETGSGMGDTLRVADEKGAYTLSDSGTYLAYRERIKLVPLLTGGSDLLNVYSAVPVNPAKVRGVNSKGAEKFIEFLLSEEGQKIISEFGRDKYGSPLFRALPGKGEPTG